MTVTVCATRGLAGSAAAAGRSEYVTVLALSTILQIGPARVVTGAVQISAEIDASMHRRAPRPTTECLADTTGCSMSGRSTAQRALAAS